MNRNNVTINTADSIKLFAEIQAAVSLINEDCKLNLAPLQVNTIIGVIITQVSKGDDKGLVASHVLICINDYMGIKNDSLTVSKVVSWLSYLFK